jgi:hypothetical protein
MGGAPPATRSARFNVGGGVCSAGSSAHYCSDQDNTTIQIILKISGVWENDNEIGITYKISKI